MTADERADGAAPRLDVPDLAAEPPEVGSVVWWRGQRATVLDVADFGSDICQVVIKLDRPAGRPPVSLRLEDLDPTGPEPSASEATSRSSQERPIRKR